MNVLELVKAAVYGIVEGVTEWLPISSTGHMLLLNQFLTMDVSEDFWNMFLVVIQLGAILAVCVMFFHRLNPFSPSKSAGEKRDTWSLWGKTVVACVPAAAIGIPIDDWMEANLGSPFVIAAALIVYGIAFIVIETVRERRAAEASTHGRHFRSADLGDAPTRSELADADARVQTLEALDWKTAIGIGLFQVLSIMPGTSRSGSTIIGGLLLGLVPASHVPGSVCLLGAFQQVVQFLLVVFLVYEVFVFKARALVPGHQLVPSELLLAERLQPFHLVVEQRLLRVPSCRIVHADIGRVWQPLELPFDVLVRRRFQPFQLIGGLLYSLRLVLEVLRGQGDFGLQSRIDGG